MQHTNLQCINSGKLGYGCIALKEIQYGCLQGVCPFFKTEDDFNAEEHEVKKRCIALGYQFVSRDQVLSNINAAIVKEKKRREAERNRKNRTAKVIRYCSKDFSFKEFDSIESAAKGSGLSVDQVEVLIKKKEEWKSYAFFKEER